MKKNITFFTSESVTEGHPDKICDQISDDILDNIISIDKNAHVACETIITTNLVLVMGEITTTAVVDYKQIIKNTLKDIGYSSMVDDDNFQIIIKIDEQSADIAMGVKKEDNNIIGAGDQGIMFGYACNETEEFMPLPISLAHKLARKLADVRKNNILPYLKPDGKTQVTIKYVDGKPFSVDTVVVSTQHSEKIALEKLREDIKTHVIMAVIPSDLIDDNTKFLINPTGRFVIGGPEGDSGLTGRKIIVDTYGGFSKHGGGAFSGKDPTKVDRSGAYMARYIAKNIVAANIATACEIQLAYAIGIVEPVSVFVNTFNTSTIEDHFISEMIKDVFDLTPFGIITALNLLNPIYKNIAAYGHMGRENLGLNWEKTDKVSDIKKYFNFL